MILPARPTLVLQTTAGDHRSTCRRSIVWRLTICCSHHGAALILGPHSASPHPTPHPARRCGLIPGMPLGMTTALEPMAACPHPDRPRTRRSSGIRRHDMSAPLAKLLAPRRHVPRETVEVSIGRRVPPLRPSAGRATVGRDRCTGTGRTDRLLINHGSTTACHLSAPHGRANRTRRPADCPPRPLPHFRSSPFRPAAHYHPGTVGPIAGARPCST